MGQHLHRQTAVLMDPAKLVDANHVFISHLHADHCDPETLLPLSLASPYCRFTGPRPVIDYLLNIGLPGDRLEMTDESWKTLNHGLMVHALPAAHPEIIRDADGRVDCVGYLFECQGRRIYHSGDTSLTMELYDLLMDYKPIHVALLPVNERNFFRERLGILGNMSIREAFQLAEDLGVETLVPMHWDMFLPNTALSEEIWAIYKGARHRYSFALNLNPFRSQDR